MGLYSGKNLKRRLLELGLSSTPALADGRRFVKRRRHEVLIGTANSQVTHRSTGIEISRACFILLQF